CPYTVKCFREVPCPLRQPLCTCSERTVTMPEETRGAAAAVRLQATTDEILSEVRRMPRELVTWIPAEGVWSVMDILCHIREFVPFWTNETLRIARRPQ